MYTTASRFSRESTLQIMSGFEAAKHDKGVRSVVKQQVRFDQ